MEIITKKVSDLKPYENNPRLNDSAVKGVAESIKQFGFKVPIVIDKNDVIVCGHTRYKASLNLGLKEVPCIVADDLTDEQIKAFRLADNKVSEEADWDYDLLFDELDTIFDIDMSDFGFDVFPEEEEEEKPEPEKTNERQRTMEAYNLPLYDEKRTSGFWQMPTLKACKHVPKDLLSFNYMLTSKDFSKGIHFYIDDYQFERFWNEPLTYIDKLKEFDCVLTPDFSLYMDMPLAMQIWNVYRSKLLGQIMQDAGIKVIPTLQWSTNKTYKFAFDGIEKGGTVSVSTIGVKRDDEANDIWFKGMDEAIRRIEPSHVVVYGGDIGYNFPCPVTYIENHNTERMKEDEE